MLRIVGYFLSVTADLAHIPLSSAVKCFTARTDSVRSNTVDPLGMYVMSLVIVDQAPELE
jgi:hypothetical protein